MISRATLVERLFRGRETRERFVASHLSKVLAFQIRSLRDRNKWSQQELAEKVGMNQNAISRLENPNYGRATISTLKRIAAAFDVALVVRFVAYSQLVDWASGTPRVDSGLSPKVYSVPNFEEELRTEIFSPPVNYFEVVNSYYATEAKLSYKEAQMQPLATAWKAAQAEIQPTILPQLTSTTNAFQQIRP